MPTTPDNKTDAELNAQVAPEDDADPRTLTGQPADAPTELGTPPSADHSEL